jgi:hypothetical protein
MNKNSAPNLDQKILETVKGKIIPSTPSLILKIFILHLTAAIISLSLCPQFGIKLFNFDINLMSSFMIFGMTLCHFFCGAFFSTLSTIIIWLGLSQDERHFIKFHKSWILALILLSSIGFFAIMRIDLFLEFSLIWILGASLFSYLTLNTLFFKFNFKKSVS